ncbi:MAG: response regulator [Anaerolineae bacterium]|nr:response regulator [Anaerolineae bacterium]
MHTILIIDDEPAICEMLTMLFEMSGYVAVAAPNARKGLELLAIQRPSLIITDFNMPGMNGGELCQHLKSNPQTCAIPAILYSASLQGMEGFEWVPADAFLAKLVPLQSILEQVKELLAA